MFSNTIKTILLLASLSGLIMGIGALVGGQTGVFIAFLISLAINFITYYFSESIVLSMYRAQLLDPNQYPDIYNDVHDLTRIMQIPMPRLWIINNAMANAFATGRSPSHASVAFTTGILDTLDAQELKGVIAHELAHIKNRDTLITTLAATLASTISYLAYMMRSLSWSRSRKNNPLNAVTLFFVGLLVPLAATIIQLALSRTREYQADETGAHTSKDPLALARALEKLHRRIPHAHLAHDDLEHASTASLFIVHPFLSGNWHSLFSTHPPMSLRIARLQEISKKMYSYNNDIR